MNQQKRIIIVGGVAGGASAAARARRLSESAEIIVFERGPDISFANCGLPYHIGGAIKNRSRLLVQTPESMHRRFNLDIRVRTEVVRIDPAAREVTARDLTTGDEYTERYDALVLSPGAEPKRPPIPGTDSEGVFTLRNLADMDAIKAVVDSGKPGRAVVVGGGYIGLEIAEALRERGMEVTMAELSHQVMLAVDPEMAAPARQELQRHGVDVRLETSVTAIRELGGGRLAAELSDGGAVECGLVVMSVGVRPETTLAREAGLAVGELGGITVDEHMRTSDPNIYAVGDAVEVTELTGGFKALIPLAGPANRQGRIAADNIFGRESAYRDTQGTAICKVFDLTVAVTGLNEKACRTRGIPFEKIYVHPASHATYYPGANAITIKLLFDPSSGNILGAQAVGGSGVDKRMDVLATALRAGMTVFDLEHLELTYAPPYGSAKDPVNYAGFSAANVLRGDVALCHYEDMANPREDQFILDVRTTREMAHGAIPGSYNIPVDDLRGRLDELPKDKELLVTCHAGLRGYLACRILMQHGFRCRNFTGGYSVWAMYSESLPLEKPTGQDLHDDAGEYGPET